MNPKTSKIMANVKMVFVDQNTRHINLECFSNNEDSIFIGVYYDDDKDLEQRWIDLDISTAIKLSKILRIEIANCKGGSNE